MFEDKPMMTINDVRLQGISTPAGPEGLIVDNLTWESTKDVTKDNYQPYCRYTTGNIVPKPGTPPE